MTTSRYATMRLDCNEIVISRLLRTLSGLSVMGSTLHEKRPRRTLVMGPGEGRSTMSGDRGAAG